MNDEELVRRCLAGDTTAFDELVRRYRNRVYSIALNLSRDRELAEDLTQEAFLRAFQRLTLFDTCKGSFSTWLITLTTRLCFNALRKQQSEKQWQMEVDWEMEAEEERLEAETPNPEEQWWAEERRLVLRRLLAALPPMQRAALILRYGEEMSIEEIAQVLQVPVGTVKAWLFRGRETLRRKLKEVGLL